MPLWIVLSWSYKKKWIEGYFANIMRLVQENKRHCPVLVSIIKGDDRSKTGNKPNLWHYMCNAVALRLEPTFWNLTTRAFTIATSNAPSRSGLKNKLTFYWHLQPFAAQEDMYLAQFPNKQLLSVTLKQGKIDLIWLQDKAILTTSLEWHPRLEICRALSICNCSLHPKSIDLYPSQLT